MNDHTNTLTFTRRPLSRVSFSQTANPTDETNSTSCNNPLWSSWQNNLV